MKVFDLHVDLSSFCLTTGRKNIKKENGLGKKFLPDQVDLPRLKKAEVRFMLANICPIIADKESFKIPDNPLAETLRQLEFYLSIANFNSEIKLGKKFQFSNKSISTAISIEGAYFIKSKLDLDFLPILKNMGVVSISPTWNISNALGTGAAQENSKKGLTKLGKEFIKASEENGIIIDAVHSSRKTFNDIIKVSRKPIFVSHAASFEVNPHRRNLTKNQMKAVAKKDGIIGLCFIQDFLGGNRLENAIDNLKSLIKYAGIDHVAIGGDFDGMAWENLVKELEDIGKMQKFLDACRKSGIKNQEIEKIAWKNAFDFFKANP